MKAVEPDDVHPVAWRCEQDRKLHPAAEPSYVVYIEEIGSAWYGAAIKRRPYFTRRMIVCRACRRTIADFDPEASTAGGTQKGGEA